MNFCDKKGEGEGGGEGIFSPFCHIAPAKKPRLI